MRRLWPFHKGLLLVKDLRDSTHVFNAHGDNLIIRQVVSLAELEACGVDEYIRQVLACNLSNSKEAFVGIINNQVVHVSCIDYAYFAGVILFGDFTIPEFRGRHIHAAVKNVMFEHLRGEKVKKVYISCSSDNQSSKNAIVRSGFRKLNVCERLFLFFKKKFRQSKTATFATELPVLYPVAQNEH